MQHMDLFWEKPGWTSDDKHLVALQKAPFQRPFPLIAVDSGPALYILRGPRQVGKSSLLKSLLAQYGQPKAAFYLSCENLADHRELSTLLTSTQRTRSLILLDEVSFVREWTRSVKHLVDSGYKGTIIVTGSHAVDLRRGADTMPGRFGSGSEIVLRPMNFHEFLLCRRSAGWPSFDREVELRMFFRIGGMPAAVAEAGPSGVPPVRALDTYERWLTGDATKLGKNVAFLRGLMAQLALTTATPISLQTLAKKTEIASHHTVQEYLHLLEDTFALRTCYALDPDTGASRFRKEKKYYFTDPIIYWIGVRMGGLPESADWEAQLAEMVGHEALARRTETTHERLGYYASSKGEVDFFSPKRWAVELKWSRAALNVSKAYNTLMVPQKFVWTIDNFLSEWPQLPD
jgi:predicted AAA+ superfamily ATPase